MSYDIDLTVNGDIVESFNITYNVSKMFYDFHENVGIRYLNGKSVEESFDFLLDLYQHLISNRDRMIEIGGWENTVKCINKMLMKAAEYPDGVWEIC